MEHRLSVARSQKKLRPSTPAGIAALYAAAGLAWILLSDLAVRRVGAAESGTVATVKEVVFVLFTALTLYALLRSRRLVRSEDLDALSKHAAETDELTQSLSEVRAAQEALSQSEARLRRLIDASLDAIVTVAADDLVLEWNEEAERLFGWSRAEAIGEKLADLILPPAERPPYADALHALVTDGEKGTSGQRFVITAVDRLNREFPIELTAAPLAWGERVVVTLFMRDVTDRVRAASEAQLIQAVVNAAPFAITGLDHEGEILSWNPAAEKMYGWSADELRGASVSLLLGDGAGDLAPLLDRVRLGVEIHAEQAQHVRRDGKTITVIRTLAPMPAVGESRRAAMITVDLSEVEQLERRLSDAEYLASLGRLAGTVAHEFNNVLMGIQSFAEVIARGAESGHDEATTRAVGQIRLGVQRGRRITDDILRFTRAAVAPTLHAISVDEWLSTVADDLQEVVAPHVTVRIDPGASGLQVIGDQGQLYQVITNLVINAADAMTRGGEIRIATAGYELENRVEITVADSGTGMDAETAAHAFEPLFTTKKRGGTGLGLAVVEKIVRVHGGEVTFDTHPGAGTTFRIRLPARPGGAPAVEDEQEARSFKPRRILLVEDDVVVAAGLADVLRSYDMIVDVLHSGAHVVEAVQRFEPDVLVLDVGLPDRSGVEVFADVAAAYPDLPVVFSTGHADEARLDGALSQPHVAFLRKPYEIESLLDQIDDVTR